MNSPMTVSTSRCPGACLVRATTNGKTRVRVMHPPAARKHHLSGAIARRGVVRARSAGPCWMGIGGTSGRGLHVFGYGPVVPPDGGDRRDHGFALANLNEWITTKVQMTTRMPGENGCSATLLTGRRPLDPYSGLPGVPSAAGKSRKRQTAASGSLSPLWG